MVHGGWRIPSALSRRRGALTAGLRVMNRPHRYQVTVLLVVILIVSALSVVPRVLLIDETLGLYWLFQVRGTIQPVDDVAVISIDGESAGAFGLSSVMAEWPRDLHARLIEGLDRSGVEVIVFDIIFDRARDPDHDRQFAQAIADAGNVILLERVRTRSVRMPGVDVGEVELEHRVLPLESLRRGALATAPFILPVVPMRVGQYWTFGRGPGDSATLPAVALAAYLRGAHERLMEAVRPHVAEPAMALPADLAPSTGNLQGQMGALRAAFREDSELARQLRLQADQAGEQILLDLYTGPDSRYLNYYGPPRTVPTWTYHEVLRQLDEGGVFDALRGRVVFVGFSESHQPEQQDSFHSVFTDSRGLHLSGVEIAATAFSNLLHRQEVMPLSVRGQWLATLLFGLVLGAVCLMTRIGIAAVVVVAAVAAYLWMAASVFSAAGLWLPLVVPMGIQAPAVLLSTLLLGYRRTSQQRQRVREALGYYVPADMVDRMTRESLRPGNDSTLLYGACLVTDADGYTKLAETMGPQALARLLNDYYAALFDAVRRHGGQVADVAGDSMVAVWTNVRPDVEMRRLACVAALEVTLAAEAFNSRLGHAALPTRVGLDAGELALGNIGAADRYEYRAVGDIVNTASRLQGLNRQLGTRVLASGAAVAQAGGYGCRDLGNFQLAGKTQALSVYELYAPAQGYDEDERLRADFAAALALFQSGDWALSAQQFRRLLEQFPADGPARFYLALIDSHGGEPPPDWPGPVRITLK